MNTADTVTLIRERLQARFAPAVLEVEDESRHHIGHAGAAGGAGHFRVRIVADAFAGLPVLQRHRLVYETLGELMDKRIHALSIDARAPGS